MTTQTFTGNQPVDEIPTNKVKKILDKEIAKNEAQQLQDPQGLKKGGAATWAGMAMRDLSEFDMKKKGGQGNMQLQADPVR